MRVDDEDVASPAAYHGHAEIARHVIQPNLSPRYLSWMASYDVASTVCTLPYLGRRNGFAVFFKRSRPCL
jgi:hypothetical protein